MAVSIGDQIGYWRGAVSYCGTVTAISARAGNFTAEFDAPSWVDGQLVFEHYTHKAIKPTDVLGVHTPAEWRAISPHPQHTQGCIAGQSVQH